MKFSFVDKARFPRFNRHDQTRTKYITENVDMSIDWRMP